MKRLPIYLLIALFSLTSCATYTAWNRTTTGAYVGSMFGSLIGDIVGGLFTEEQEANQLLITL